MAALVFGFDQTNKWWMLFIYNISENQPVEITSFFELVLVWNKGVSYGLFSGHQQGFLIAMALVISALLWVWASRSENRLGAWAFGLIIMGTLMYGGLFGMPVVETAQWSGLPLTMMLSFFGMVAAFAHLLAYIYSPWLK